MTADGKRGEEKAFLKFLQFPFYMIERFRHTKRKRPMKRIDS
jgi:hypothetical protein